MKNIIALILALFFIASCTQPEPAKENKATIQYFNVPFNNITPDLLLDSGFIGARPKRLFYPKQQARGWMRQYYKGNSFYIMHTLDNGDTTGRYSVNIKYSDDENN